MGVPSESSRPFRQIILAVPTLVRFLQKAADVTENAYFLDSSRQRCALLQVEQGSMRRIPV
jgi:hypothetical protein